MIGCLFIPDFPAWAHQSQRPAWRRIAVYHRGEIAARTRPLIQAGLQIGESLERARVLFPDARFLEQNYPLEQAVWDNVVQRVHETTPFLSPIEPGCLFFKPFSFNEACDLSGAFLAGVGLGPDRSIARIAAIRSTVGSALQIKGVAVERFLASTKTGVLTTLGFEESLVERLLLFGLQSLGDIRRLSRRHLDAQFGPTGLALFDFLHPDSRAEQVPLYTPPPAITEMYDLDGAPLQWLPLNHLLERLSRRAVRRLGSRQCKRVRLEMKTQNVKIRRMKQRILKTATSSLGEIQRVAAELLKQLLEEASDAETLVLTLASLRNSRYAQATLFFERPPPSDAISSVEDRFPGIVRRAVIVNPDAPFHEDAVQLIPVKPQSTSP